MCVFVAHSYTKVEGLCAYDTNDLLSYKTGVWLPKKQRERFVMVDTHALATVRKLF